MLSFYSISLLRLMSGCLGVWVSGCLGVWVSGCLGVWVSGCLGVWVSGCLGVCYKQSPVNFYLQFILTADIFS
jgi:hypothetical protein